MPSLYNNDRPGAFQLSEVNLISYKSPDGSGTPARLDIRNLITEFNIYESLDSNFITGDISLTDGTNAIQELPLTGYERIEFYFRSPGTDKGFNFSVKNGHPMFVYSLKNRQQLNPRSQFYTLRFCSLEAIRDHQTRISQAFTGNIDQMVTDICINHLKTKKDILVEETKSNHKFVIPRIKPTKAIDQLRKAARSLHFENSGFLFFENATGFQFKSYEGLFCKKDGTPREVKAHYAPKIKNTGEDDIYMLQSVESFRIIQQYDTLQNTAHGVYASRLITHDLYNKTFSETDFDYNLEYSKQNHLEQDAKGGIRGDNSILPLFNYDSGDTFDTKYEGTVFYQSETAKVHDTHELPDSKNILQKRVSQHIATNALVIEITVPGHTEIQTGDIVHFTLPDYSIPDDTNKTGEDIYLTGRYLIKAARHHVSALNKRHTMVLELIKDSFSTEYPDEAQDLWTNNEEQDGLLYSATEVDDYT